MVILKNNGYFLLKKRNFASYCFSIFLKREDKKKFNFKIRIPEKQNKIQNKRFKISNHRMKLLIKYHQNIKVIMPRDSKNNIYILIEIPLIRISNSFFPLVKTLPEKVNGHIFQFIELFIPVFIRYI